MKLVWRTQQEHRHPYGPAGGKMGLPLLTEKIAIKIWTTVTWAVHDDDVPVMQALRSMFGWRTTAWWENRPSWGTAWDPGNVQRWKHKGWVP